jgi:hypothetical protein
MDGLIAANTEALDSLPIEERALVPGGLPTEISICNIGVLAFPGNKLKQDALILALIALCKDGTLEYYGDINGWSYWDNEPNPFPKVKGDYPHIYCLDSRPQMLYAHSHDCLIHRDNFKAYLQSVEQWPVNGLLANWWDDAEVIGNPRRGKYNACDLFALSFLQNNPKSRTWAKRVLRDKLYKHECFKSISFDNWGSVHIAAKSAT